ncbi:3-oxoacid CoA-transferase subunit A [Aquabacter spiritensis]|uniref:3-oxoadipate CoA-transferase alpha subunit n=1 Tax=Aquabacter spiritensis TaxID=933073 RepID=A0A4R3LST7_9HYPH|nr:3-oxoacid CoA-transferase subunit A [Aquabacter spiritensis]TCT03592.1 3-oxoadipate CoA-transferase alpha subunit [Aquabacter spiritensis]
MKQKRHETPLEAIDRMTDNSVVFVGGFGRAGVPERLVEAVCRRKLRGLTIVSNNAGSNVAGIASLLQEGCVGKIICSFPLAREAVAFRDLYDRNLVDLEVVPQGTLAERIRAGGAGLGGVLTPTGVGTDIAEGKPLIEIDGRAFLIERALRADFALIKAYKVDPLGNLIYRKAARNFNPIMAMAADWVIVEAAEEVGIGALDPEHIITPGVYVDAYCAVTRIDQMMEATP